MNTVTSKLSVSSKNYYTVTVIRIRFLNFDEVFSLTPKVGVVTYYSANCLPKTIWKWKNLDPEGGASLALPGVCQLFQYLDGFSSPDHWRFGSGARDASPLGPIFNFMQLWANTSFCTYSAIHKATGLTVPGHSIIWLGLTVSSFAWYCHGMTRIG